MLPDSGLPGEFAAHMTAIARGDKPLPTSTANRHHFVPEFLLRRFRGRTERGKRLFVLDKHDGSVVECAPKDAGWRERLYSIDSVDGQHDGMVEGLFGLAENYASKSLNALLVRDREPVMTEGDRANIAFLIAAQEQRVPGALEELRTSMIIGATSFAAVELANLKGPRKKQREGREGYEALISGKASLHPSAEAVLEMALNALAHTAGIIFNLPWTLLRAKSGAGSFICSDRPLTMFDPSPPHQFSAPGWLSSENVAAAMPLSSFACLRISPRDRALLSTRETTLQVDRINRFTYGFADRYVYGPSAAELEEIHARAMADPDAIPTPIPKRMVMLEDLETADPAVADANVARGWDPYLMVKQDDGSERPMSYEVIDSLEDAMKAISPREVEGRLAALDPIPPPSVTSAS